MVRQGTSVDDLWLIAARNGAGTRTVTFKGLPRWAHRADVYTEDRTIKASGGSFSDRFSQWDVHVYHFVEALSLFRVAPTRAGVGAHVTLHGKGLAAAKSVSFGGVKGRFKIVSDSKLVATVPQKAKSGPVAVTSALKQVQTKTRFRIVPSAKTKPRITGIARLGHRLKATTGVWYEKPSGYSVPVAGLQPARERLPASAGRDRADAGTRAERAGPPVARPRHRAHGLRHRERQLDGDRARQKLARASS